jgi:hypothetical protein
MTVNISFSGKWKGEFVYGPEYGDIEGEKATFMFFVDKNDETGFEGRSFDIDGVGVNAEVAIVRGFIDDDMISFIKQYPTTVVFQQDGSLETISTKPSPEIHYIGEYNERLQMFKGSWEMVWSEVKQGEGYLEYLCTGKWEMRKEED